MTPLAKLKSKLNSSNIDAALISSVKNIIYLTGYRGFSEEDREAFLVITKKKQFIITDGRYTEAIKKILPEYELLERSIGTNPFELIKQVIQSEQIRLLGIEEDNLTAVELRQILQQHQGLSPFSLADIREVKSETEIKNIEAACHLADLAFKYVLTKVKAGITEKELAFELEYYIRKNGGELAFDSIVAFGENSAVPHHLTSRTRLEAGDKFVLFDFGAKIDGYCSDMTRTVFFGKATEKQKKQYQAVLSAQTEVVEFLNHLLIEQSGEIEAKLADQLARGVIEQAGFEPYKHGLGHGVGVHVHERPVLSTNSSSILKAGMVFSIEPGIYIPKFGGVRIEDLFLLTDTGLKQLTQAPKELVEINR